MRFGIILDDLFTRHLTPSGHPERPDRVRSILETLKEWEGFRGLQQLPPVTAEEECIKTVHSRNHLERIKKTAGQSFNQLDPDTYTSPESFEIALKGVGSFVKLVELVLKRELDSGFAVVRPPGHHAESNRAMGFCLFNTVAIAAQLALKQGGARKTAIVDFDVHHGNGTQEIFYSRSDVLYISQHQYPFYPGTGHFREVGEGTGKGFTVNFPIQAGMGNHFYGSLFRDFVIPVLRQYRPDLILVSAGYDAHRDDPLGGMSLDEDGYGELVNLLNTVAQEVSEGRIAYVLEGGYNLQALAQSVRRTIATTLEPRKFEIQKEQEGEYAAYREQLRAHFGQWWRL